MPRDLRGAKLAFSMDLGRCRIEDGVAANTCAAVDALRDLGATAEEVDLTKLEVTFAIKREGLAMK